MKTSLNKKCRPRDVLFSFFINSADPDGLFAAWNLDVFFPAYCSFTVSFTLPEEQPFFQFTTVVMANCTCLVSDYNQKHMKCSVS